MSSMKQRWTKCVGVPWLGSVIHSLWRTNWYGLTTKPHGKHIFECLDIGTSLVTQDPISITIEGALWGSIQAHGMLREIVIVSDDTGQLDDGSQSSAGHIRNDWDTSWIHSPICIAPHQSLCAR